jgi:hypothetical protein
MKTPQPSGEPAHDDVASPVIQELVYTGHRRLQLYADKLIDYPRSGFFGRSTTNIISILRVSSIAVRHIGSTPALQIGLRNASWDKNWGSEKWFNNGPTLDEVRTFANALVTLAPEASFKDIYEKERAQDEALATRQERESTFGDGVRSASDLVEVSTYKTTKDYERDARARVAMGWSVAGQSQETGQTHRIRGAASGGLMGSLIGFPFAGALVGGLSGKRSQGSITVTWTKSAGAAPTRSDGEHTTPDASDGLAEQLDRLAQLHRNGELSDEEFAAAKRKALGQE